MTYVMSDIHGEYDKYIAMLEKICFSDDDTLYIIGDILDRGPEPIKLLRDMSMRANVFPIMGNHEYMAKDVLSVLLVEISEENYNTQIDDDTIRKLFEWQQNGGTVTLEQFKALPNEERFELFDYLDEFTNYETIDIDEKTFVLVHSGFMNFDPNKDLDEYLVEELILVRPDYSKQNFYDKSIYIVSGHTPTLAITGKPLIYKENNNICIDCGATFGGKLACLRLEDMKEFYL